MATTLSNSIVNYHWRQIFFSINQKNSELTTNSGTAFARNNNGRRNLLPKFWLLTCCVTPKSEVLFYFNFFQYNIYNFKFRIDSSMIGQPTNFRHIGHMGADDMSSLYNVKKKKKEIYLSYKL